MMPSLWEEPGGIAALEALAVGTPVVAYRNGGLAEYVSDIQGGLVVEPRALALADAVDALHSRPGAWEKHSRDGLRGVAQHHAADSYVSRVEELYRAVTISR
jgi:glycosyltransferase involved in cell wall biosynthesis